MENPFELILKRLDDIECMLRNTSHTVIQTTTVTEILNLEQAAEYISYLNLLFIRKHQKETYLTLKGERGFILNDLNWMIG